MGEHMPLMHPDNEKNIIDGVSKNIIAALEKILTKASTARELQTFSLKEAANILGTTPATLRDHTEKGLFDAVKLGKNYIVPQHAIIKKLNGK